MESVRNWTAEMSTDWDPDEVMREIAADVERVTPKKDEARDNDSNTEWHFHHDDNPAPTLWLIKNILPEAGAGLISGQWGTYKTTVALDLAVSVMTGTPFAKRYAVKRPGGVAYFALEGIGGLASRLTAIAHTHDSAGALPFAYRGDCPALTAADALDKLTIMIEAATRQIQDRFNVATVLVFIDTVVTAAGYTKSGDDNDAAVAQRIMSVLSGLSQRTGALAVGIDHFGKITETGTRGSSAKEGHADAVLALLADRELAGTITNTRLAVRKLRDGFSGLELPFTPKTLEIGTDADGDPITRVIIDWTTATEERPSDKAWSKSLRLLRRIIMNSLVDGIDTQPFLDGPTVRACSLDLVRAEFNKQYFADGDATQKASIRRKAFKRAIADAQAKGLVAMREINGTQMVWLAKAEAGS
jgi:AAA domain